MLRCNCGQNGTLSTQQKYGNPSSICCLLWKCWTVFDRLPFTGLAATVTTKRISDVHLAVFLLSSPCIPLLFVAVGHVTSSPVAVGNGTCPNHPINTQRSISGRRRNLAFTLQLQSDNAKLTVCTVMSYCSFKKE